MRLAKTPKPFGRPPVPAPARQARTMTGTASPAGWGRNERRNLTREEEAGRCSVGRCRCEAPCPVDVRSIDRSIDRAHRLRSSSSGGWIWFWVCFCFWFWVFSGPDPVSSVPLAAPARKKRTAAVADFFGLLCAFVCSCACAFEGRGGRGLALALAVATAAREGGGARSGGRGGVQGGAGSGSGPVVVGRNDAPPPRGGSRRGARGVGGARGWVGGWSQAREARGGGRRQRKGWRRVGKGRWGRARPCS